MPKKKEKPKVKIKKPKENFRTIDCIYQFSTNEHNILNEVSTETKSVYNFYLFCYKAFNQFKDDIYRDALSDMNKYLDREKLLNHIHKIFDKYYKFYSDNFRSLQNNNNILYSYLKKYKLSVFNYNFNDLYYKVYFECLTLKGLIKPTKETNKLLYSDVITHILKTFYISNYQKTKDELLHKKKLTIMDEKFINHVKTESMLFSKKEDSYYTQINIIFKGKFYSQQHIIRQYAHKLYKKFNRKLTSDIIINTMDNVYDMISSFYEARKAGTKANFPKYLQKGSKYKIPFFSSARKEEIIDGKHKYRLLVSMDNTKEKRNEKSVYIWIPKPKKLNKMQLKEINIVPLYDGFKYKICYMYVKEKIVNNIAITAENSISIDLGVKNLMTIYNPTGEQKIIRGSRIKCTNELYNYKINQKKSELKTRNNKYTSNKLQKLYMNREKEINKNILEIVNTIKTYYSSKKILIIGYNEKWKQNVNLGKTTNRKFVSIPYKKIIKALRYHLKDKQIIEVNEYYTSKCDALALEDIKKQEIYQGNREKRGLFSSSVGKLINADINGSINIMRKYFDLREISGKNICNPSLFKITQRGFLVKL
jgi:transposase